MTQKWEETTFKDPIARAKGLGAAHNGLHHWWHQRVTAVAAVPLVLWGVWSAMTLAAAGGDFDSVQGFFAQPYNAVLMLLFLSALLYHMVLGLQIVIEDYIHTESRKVVLLLLVRLGSIALYAVGVFSVLKMAV